jgi:hypothetical protein
VNTPCSNDGKLGGDFLATPLGRQAGCRALDSLAGMIASTEGFFDPSESNSGSWTADVCHGIDYVLNGRHLELIVIFQLSAFFKYIVYDFNKSKLATSFLTLCY